MHRTPATRVPYCKHSQGIVSAHFRIMVNNCPACANFCSGIFFPDRSIKHARHSTNIKRPILPSSPKNDGMTRQQFHHQHHSLSATRHLHCKIVVSCSLKCSSSDARKVRDDSINLKMAKNKHSRNSSTRERSQKEAASNPTKKKSEKVDGLELFKPAASMAILFLALLVLHFRSDSSSSEKSGLNLAHHELEEWQKCHTFLAPTNATGWGVFAARDYQHQELLEITPLYFPLETFDDEYPMEHSLAKFTQLDDYIYGIHRRHLHNKRQKIVLLGNDMVYNHHPDENSQLGLGPGYTQGIYAKHELKAGDEIYGTYGTTDGGAEWFQARGLALISEMRKLSPSQLEWLSARYCSKIYAGPGRRTYAALIPSVDVARIAPFEAGLNDARAKVHIASGDQIEQAPAMLMFKSFVEGSALAPLVITWDNLLPEHHQALKSAAVATNGKVPVQYQGPSSEGKRMRYMTILEDVAILPYAGRIGMVERVGPNANVGSNCRLEVSIGIIESGDDSGIPYASVDLTLIATADIEVGETLLMNVDSSGNAVERSLLKAKLEEIGFPFQL